MIKKKTILLVEDDFLVATAEKIALEDYGYKVILSRDGDSAIDHFKETNCIDLVLMDIDLGIGKDGTETAEVILKTNNVPIVFLSSHTETEVVAKTEKITSYGYVVKNSNSTVLDASIKMAFKLFDANKQILESEIKQKSMIANSSDVICIVDSGFLIKYISPNVLKLFGWQDDEVLNLDWFSFVHSDDVSRVKYEFSDVVENSVKTMEYDYLCKDGSSKQIEITATNMVNDPVINGILLNYHDISSRRQIEDALSESKILFHRLIESLPQHVFAKDLDGRFIFVNDRCCQLQGKPQDEIIGKTDFDFHPVDLALKYQKDDLKVIEKNIILELEEEHQSIGGEKSFVNVIKAPFYDSRGTIIGLLGIFWDITKRKQDEIEKEEMNLKLKTANDELLAAIKKLETANEDLIKKDKAFIDERSFTEALLDVVPGMLYVYDEHLHLVRWNKKNEEMIGYSSEELFSMTVEDWFEKDDLAMVMNGIEKVLTEGQGQVEVNLLLKGGKKKLMQLNTALLIVEGKKYFTGIGIDISEHKQREIELKELNKKYSKLASDIPGYIAYVDADNLKYEYVNDAFEKSFSITREKIIGSHIKDVIGESNYQFALKYIDEVRKGNSISYENFFNLTSGKRWIQVNYSPVFNSDNKVKSIAVFSYDITESKNKEEQIKSLLTEKEILLKEVHHRTKNYMNTVYSLLKLQEKDTQNPSVIASLDDAASRVRGMMILYDRLYKSDNLAGQKIKSFIPELVKDIIANFPNSKSVTAEINAQDIELDFKVLQTIGIIINELVTNAMKYAFSGKANGRIVVTVETRETAVFVEVADNGNGLPEMFDLDDSSGFGLKLVKMLVEHLSGSLHLESKDGVKFSFEFYK